MRHLENLAPSENKVFCYHSFQDFATQTTTRRDVAPWTVALNLALVPSMSGLEASLGGLA